jgi:predicted acetyltransferase
MLRSALEELHSQGMPLSTLYPATLPYYQRGGYERAGKSITYELPLDSINERERGLELVPMTAEHEAEVKRLYTARARRSAGNLDRPAWMWERRLAPKDQPCFRYMVMNGAQAEGYVVYSQAGRTDPLKVADVCALTPAAGRRILELFAGYRSMVESVVWTGGPLDPLLYLLRENLIGGDRLREKIRRDYDWMLRIVDITGALSGRGYPPELRAELHLDVRDSLLPANNRRFVLQVADGRGVVQSGGQGRITLDMRDLAAIYTGFMAPAERRIIGAIDGPDADLALMGAVFSGPRPWIADMF